LKGLSAEIMASRSCYGKPFVPPVKGNVKGNGEVNCNGKQLTNGKRNDSVNGKKSNNAQS
jgi:hypothetical protein